MTWTRRVAVLALSFGIVVGLLGPAPASVAAPAGDVSATAPRPPFDPGTGAPITRKIFSNPDGSVSCGRVYTEMVWLECLLVRTNEIVRFGPDESWIDVPCKAPNQSESCRLAFGAVMIKRATKADAARFAGARRIPLERLVELGARTVPYPACIADPNLGLSCTTLMDDSVGQQIYLGLAGSIWSCPGYEYSTGDTPIPQGSNRCRVGRP
jgi:hypothetical protein